MTKPGFDLIAAAKMWLCLTAIPAAWPHPPFPYIRTALGGLGAARTTPGDCPGGRRGLSSCPTHLSSPPPNKQIMLDCCDNPLL